MKIKVFTHIDLDGIGPVVLLKALLDADIDYECHGYGSIDWAVNAYFNDKAYLDYDMTFITDISVRQDYAIEAIRSIYNTGHKIALFDHHATAEHLNKYLWANVQTEKPNCGTSLVFNYIMGDPIPASLDDNVIHTARRFSHLVSQWDTWLWAESDCTEPKELNDLFYLYGREAFLDKMVSRIKQYEDIFQEEDISALVIRQRQIDEYIKRKSEQLMIVDRAYNDLTAGVVFAEDYISELGHELLNMFDEIDYIIMINPGSKVASLRARDNSDVDVEAIAKSKSGGGHIKASGHKIPSPIYEDWIMDAVNI